MLFSKDVLIVSVDSFFFLRCHLLGTIKAMPDQCTHLNASTRGMTRLCL